MSLQKQTFQESTYPLLILSVLLDVRHMVLYKLFYCTVVYCIPLHCVVASLLYWLLIAVLMYINLLQLLGLDGSLLFMVCTTQCMFHLF